jgi:hypothetical protein
VALKAIVFDVGETLVDDTGIRNHAPTCTSVAVDCGHLHEPLYAGIPTRTPQELPDGLASLT